MCKPCTAQEDAKLPVVNGTSVVQELETEREDCQCPCKNRRGGVIKTHTFVFKKYFSLKSVCNCAPSPPLWAWGGGGWFYASSWLWSLAGGRGCLRGVYEYEGFNAEFFPPDCRHLRFGLCSRKETWKVHLWILQLSFNSINELAVRKTRSSGPSFYTKIGILRPYHRIKMSETIHIILHVRDLIRKGRPTFSPHLSLQTPNQSFHKVLPHLRLQSKVEDGPEEHWLLSAQDSWKTSTTALLVLALLSTLLFLILLSAVAKIAKHLFRY